jgi:hypothetical protein
MVIGATIFCTAPSSVTVLHRIETERSPARISPCHGTGALLDHPHLRARFRLILCADQCVGADVGSQLRRRWWVQLIFTQPTV